MSEEQANTEDVQVGVPPLTHRELQVTRGISYGLSNSEISDDMGISTKTFDTHRGHALRKLELRNNVALARRAIASGLVTLDGHHIPSLLQVLDAASDVMSCRSAEGAKGLSDAFAKLDSALAEAASRRRA